LNSPTVYTVPATGWRRFWRVLKLVCISAYEDNCFGLAKGAAYSSLLSFFPVLASIAAILVLANAEAVASVLSSFLFEVVPPGTEDLVKYQFAVKGQRPIWLLVVASLLSLWAASGVMMSLMEGFQAAYRLPSGRSFLHQRLVAVMLVMLTAIPAVGASALILFAGRAEIELLQWGGVETEGEQIKTGLIVLSRISTYTIAFLATVLATGLLYYFGPNRPLKFRSVWPGAFLATLLWLLATSGFAWYVRNIANYNLLYGSLGAVIALLVWMYVMAIVALIGCEFNAERERLATVPQGH